MRDFDSLLDIINGFGTYQKIRFLFLCIPAVSLSPFAFYSLLFTSYTPEHSCKLPQDTVSLIETGQVSETFVQNLLQINESSCEIRNISFPRSYWNQSIPAGFLDALAEIPLNETRKCPNGWQYDTSDWNETIVTKWDLVCDRDWIVHLFWTFVYIGSILGLLVFPFISDQYGRRPAFFLSISWYIVTGTLLLFMPNWIWMLVMILIKNIATSNCFQMPYIYATEIVGPKYHTLVLVTTCVAYSIGACLAAVAAWLCRTWVQFTLISTLPAVAFLTYWGLFDESPRWLLAKGNAKRAKKIVRLMADRNGVKIGENQLDHLVDEINESEHEKVEMHGKYGIWTIFSHPNLLKKAVILMLIWGVDEIVYTGLLLNVENFGGNQYLVLGITGIVEILAALLLWLIVDRSGRIFLLSISTILAGISSAFVLATSSKSAIMGLIVIAKFCNVVSVDILYLVGVELFPTVIRASGLSFCTLMGYIISIPTPFIAYSGKHMKQLPMIIFGVLSIFVGILCLLLPETSQQHLLETLEDDRKYPVGLEALKKNMTFWKKEHAADHKQDSTPGCEL